MQCPTFSNSSLIVFKHQHLSDTEQLLLSEGNGFISTNNKIYHATLIY